MLNNKTCLLCGKKTSGRSDKKFCSDACRYEFNNQKRVSNNEPLYIINAILTKNRSILNKICVGQSTIITYDELISKEFNFDYFTNLQVDNKKQIYYFCYDFVYIPIYDRQIKKVKVIRFIMRKLSWDPWRYVKNPVEKLME